MVISYLLLKGFPFWAEMLIAALLDLLIGDPPKLWHPVKMIGRWIQCWEKFLRGWIEKYPSKNPLADERKAGCLLGSITVLFFGLLAWIVPRAFGCIGGPLVASIIEIVLLYFAMAARSLAKAGKRVYRSLCSNDIVQARIDLQSLVGRDTECLREQEIVRATCESVAENTNDGVIAPLFFMGIGGLFAATWIGSLAVCFVWIYKSVSTLDSMVGYRNKCYEHFGAFSAKMDDVFAFLPARLSGLLLCIAACFLIKNGKASFQTMMSQHNCHPSPNSAWSESAAAGALQMRMGGGAYYQGRWKEKPMIGEDKSPVTKKMIPLMNRLMFLAAFLAFVLAVFYPLTMIVLSLLMALMGEWSDLLKPPAAVGKGCS